MQKKLKSTSGILVEPSGFALDETTTHDDVERILNVFEQHC